MSAAIRTPAGGPLSPARLGLARWALLFGNFAIGCGVMVAPGSLNDLARSLAVSVSTAGQLITIGAMVVCFTAPLLGGWVAGFDRRRLLAWTLMWYAAGHALCALMPNYAALLPLRAATMLAAGIFTAQAAAAVGVMAPPERRAGTVAFIFLGWSLASVLGMPAAAWIGETHGWRAAYWSVTALSLLGAAWVALSMPDGVRPPAISLAAWGGIFRHRVMMSIIGVTTLLVGGQFTVMTYFAPYSRDVLHLDAAGLGTMLMWFGACGLVGNMVVARTMDRTGPGRTATIAAVMVILGLLAWPLAGSLPTALIALTPWGLACFAANSAQQARLGRADPNLGAALMALNSSAIYLGQALGSSTGGWLIAHGGYAPLSWVALVLVGVALALSVWVQRQHVRPAAATPSGSPGGRGPDGA